MVLTEIIPALLKAASKAISFDRVLYGLGIRFVGSTVAKKLASHFKNIKALNSDNTR